jgi:hypothetical protein
MLFGEEEWRISCYPEWADGRAKRPHRKGSRYVLGLEDKYIDSRMPDSHHDRFFARGFDFPAESVMPLTCGVVSSIAIPAR